MLDLKAIRRDPEAVRAALARRGDGSDARLDEALALDERRRELLPEVEGLRARQNEASQGIAQAKKAGEDAAGAIAEMQEVARRVKALTEELAAAEAALEAAVGSLPNPPAVTAADADETLREVGEPHAAGARARPPRPRRRDDRHGGGRARVGLALRLPEGRPRAARARALPLGARGAGRPRLRARSIPPVLVREEALHGTGFLPDTEQQIYRLADDDLYLVGTSEVPLASLHAGEILDGARLPLRYAGLSPCFRREAGAAGRDTRGIFRVHQFDKVEMFSFVEPDAAGR